MVLQSTTSWFWRESYPSDLQAQDHWTERGRATSVSNSNITGRPRRSVLTFDRSMKPTRAQYFYAKGRPLQVLFLLLLVGAPLCFAYIVAGLLAHVYPPLSDIWNLLLLVFFVFVALLLGFLLALVAGSFLTGIFWRLLRPLYKARAIQNGAPFRVGDHVQILVGHHKGRVARVYSGWKDGCVRVELGEREAEKFKDIFDALQLLRENVEPDAAPSSRPPSELPVSPEVESSDSQRTPSSGGYG